MNKLKYNHLLVKYVLRRGIDDKEDWFPEADFKNGNFEKWANGGDIDSLRKETYTDTELAILNSLINQHKNGMDKSN